MVQLKYLSNFWKTLEVLLIDCEVNLTLTWPNDCVIVYTNVANQRSTFARADTKLYVPVVTLSTQDNAKFLPQLQSGFIRKINWSKYLPKPESLEQNPDLNYLVEPSFQGINTLFVLAFDNDEPRESNRRYYLSNVEIKVCNL